MIDSSDIEERLRAVAAMDLRTGGFLAHTMDTAAIAAAEINQLRAERARLRATIADLTEALDHLRARVRALTGEGAGRYWEGRWRDAEATTNDLVAALWGVLDDIADYELMNKLAPNPGKQDCWQSVTRARAAIDRAQGGKE